MARVGDLFPDYEKYDFVKGKGRLARTYGKSDKCRLARGVFHSFMNLVMDDVVEGDVFEFPAYDAKLYIEKIPEFALKRMRENNQMETFDNAMVEAPHAPTYRFKSSNRSSHKFRVIFDKQRYSKMMRNLHEGKRYSNNIGVW